MAVTKATTKSVAIILPTARPGRNSPRVAKFVLESIKRNIPQDVTVKIIDLAEWKLPTWAEPEVPATVKSAELYSSEIVRRWSSEISSHQGYIFLAPEYNGSYAGTLKNALDFLYNEWVGKAAMVVSYGARPVNALKGGNHFADALDINQMKVSASIPKISIASMDREKTAAGPDLVFYEKEVEEQSQKDVVVAWNSMLENLEVSTRAFPVSA